MSSIRDRRSSGGYGVVGRGAGRRGIAAWVGTLVLGTAVLLGGCGVKEWPTPAPVKAAPMTATPEVPAPAGAKASTSKMPYFMQVGDVMDIKFFYNPELNENVVIRPDGKMSLQLIGDVQAAGRTPEQLRKTLEHDYANVLRQPEVAVIVRKFTQPRIYVGGEVRAPGALKFNGHLTVLQSIVEAGGFKPEAELQNVVVLRNTGKGRPQYIQLNLHDYLGHEAASRAAWDACMKQGHGAEACRKDSPFAGNEPQDIALQPLDVVYVPQKRIARVAEFFDLYINKILPIYRNMGLSFTYAINPEVRVKGP